MPMRIAEQSLQIYSDMESFKVGVIGLTLSINSYGLPGISLFVFDPPCHGPKLRHVPSCSAAVTGFHIGPAHPAAVPARH